MLKKDNIYKFEIIDVGINFEGIAKDEKGLTVFIPGALKGEVVEAKIIKVNKSYALGEVKNYISKSSKRNMEDCKSYKLCGGCAARHMDYDETLDIKLQNVINTLKKQNVDTSKIGYIYGMGVPYHYRNKLQYPVRLVKGKTVMGMFTKSTHDIVENVDCLIQDKHTDQVARSLFKLIVESGFIGYDEQKCIGDIRNIMVRRGTHTNEIMCVVVVNDRKLAADRRFKTIVHEIIKAYPDITSFVLNINEENTNVILSNSNVCIYGNEYITDKIGDYVFKITADSFFQVNTIQAEVLYSLLKENLKLEKDKNLLELYSGVGSIGIFLADSVKDVYSVEIIESATLAAKENARLNDITNIINVNGDASQETLKLVEQGKYFDYIVVDPPRKGIDLDGIELILKLQPKKIGYVSCNPATLARDLQMLCTEKYKIESIELVDMFPWTSHVECCSVLELKESTEI